MPADERIKGDYEECFKNLLRKRINKMRREIIDSIKLIEKLNLDVNKESVALVCAIKRIGCEVNRPMIITVELLSSGGKLVKVNNIDMVYLRGGLFKTLHDVLKDLSRMVVGDTDFIDKPLKEFENGFFSKIVEFPEEYEDNFRKLFTEYYKEYLVDNLDEILLITRDNISADFKKRYLNIKYGKESFEETVKKLFNV